MLIQIPGTNLFRDTDSMALINKDFNGLEEYNMKRKMMATQKSEINNVKSEINTLKNDMQEIKQLILQLIGKG